MKLRKNGILFYIILTLSVISCEYDLKKENFKQIQPPSDFQVYDLNLVSGKDTIKVFNPTEINYNIILPPGVKIKQGFFSLCGNLWNASSGNGKFSISPNNYPVGIDTLFLILTTSTGSGSIAEYAGKEDHVIKKYWITVIDGRYPPPIVVSKSITSDGLLKISWTKCDQYNFCSYEVEGVVNSIRRSIIIKNKDSTSFTEPCFIGGTGNFKVSVRVFTGNVLRSSNTLFINDFVPTLKFEELSIDTLRVYWNKSKYNAYYTLTIGSNTIFESSTDTSYIYPNASFGTSPVYKLSTFPSKVYTSDPKYTRSDEKYHVCGNYIGFDCQVPFTYNYIDKVIYSRTYNEIVCFDPKYMNLLSHTTLGASTIQLNYSCPTNSTKIATETGYSIFVFPDKSLKDPIIIPLSASGLDIVDYLYLTDNDLIAVAVNKKYQLISVAEKKIITSIDIEDYPYYSKWACFSTSKDGKFACIVTKNGLVLYQIENGIATKIYSDNRVYRSVQFDLINPERFYLTFYDNNVLEIRKASDFSLISSLNLPSIAEVIRNVDLESGYMFLTDYSYLYIMDLKNSRLVFKITSPTSKPLFYSNKIFTEAGYWIDISKYL